MSYQKTAVEIEKEIEKFNDDVEILKNQYIFYHQINQNNYFLKELFQPNSRAIHSKRCDECQIQFANHR